MVLAVTIGKKQINFIVKVVFPRSGESDIHPRQQRGQRISLQEKAVLHAGVMTRIADRSRPQRDAIHLFKKEVKEWFVGRTESCLDTCFTQLHFGGKAARLVVEQPGFHLRAAHFRFHKTFDKRVNGAGIGFLKKHAHREVLPVGSRLSRSQSPRRLRPSTVNRMARPGNMLTHQAVWR